MRIIGVKAARNAIMGTFKSYNEYLKNTIKGPIVSPVANTQKELDKILSSQRLTTDLFDGLGEEGYNYLLAKCAVLIRLYDLSIGTNLENTVVDLYIDSFGSVEEDRKLALEHNMVKSRLTYTAIGLPDEGPCYMRALIGVAETFTGKSLGAVALESLVQTLITGNHPLVNINLDYLVLNSEKIIEAALNILLDRKHDTGSDYSIIVGRPDIPGKDFDYAQKNVMFTLLPVARHDGQSSGHWQEGDASGNFLWDPLDGASNTGRAINTAEIRYVVIKRKEGG